MTSFPDLEVALISSEPEQRRQAASLLVSHGGSDRVRLLLQALGDSDWRVRKEAVAVAGRLAPNADSLNALVAALQPGENVGLRNAAVEALSRYGEPAVSALNQTLPSLDADGRKLAAEALAMTGSAGALVGLEQLLEDDDPNVRAAAVEAIAGIGTASIEKAVELLESCLTSEDQFMRLAALDGLNRLGVVLRFEQVEALLSDRVLARSALIAAGRCQDPRAALPLVSALNSARGATWNAALQSVSDLAATGVSAEGSVRRALEGLSAGARKKLLHLATTPGDDEASRRMALLVCGALGGRDAAEAAISALEDDAMAGEAEQALLMIGADAVPALIRLAADGPRTSRIAAVTLLGRLLATTKGSDNRRGIDVVLQGLDSGEPAIVKAALLALSEINDERALEPASRWLRTDVAPGLRAAAVQSLNASAVSFPVAARKLARAHASEPDGGLLVATLIASLGGEVLGSLEDDLSYLSDALNNSSTAVRRSAVEALCRIPSERGVEIVVFALTDEERDVQLAAVKSLGRIRRPDGSPAGVERLLQLIDSSTDDILVAAALHSLGDTADPRALDVLKPLARSGSAMAAVSAVEALGRLSLHGSGQEGRAVEALIDSLSHPDAEVVKSAVRVLADQRDPRVVTHLGACLDHEAWDVRRLAADLLGRIGGASTLELLKARLSTESEPLVREAVQRALIALESASGRRTTTPPPGSVMAARKDS
ncbi:MAG: HEAT repeat domain-containing protein [Polyangiaceae bacterium]